MAGIISRSDWGARAPESITPWNVANLLGICYHHFGSPRAADDHSGCDNLMRSVQNFHMDVSDEDFVDIAYNFCVCPHGFVFEGRGWDHQTGANGTTVANQTFLAVCYMGNSDEDGFRELAQDASAKLFASGFKKGINRVVVPHRKFTGSECPGDKAHAWVTSGDWKKDLPSVNRVRWEAWDDGDMLEASIWVEPSKSDERLAMFVEGHKGKLDNTAQEEGKSGDVRLVRRVK